ncbi:MAG: HD domain-containing protein [Lachnospiraceae bacterium]|nr:HD domain-containing protein [Lachnospiraceae bacterium]
MQAEVCRDRTLPYLEEIFKDKSGSHGPDHTLRVYNNAMLIADGEPSCDRVLIALAALLHDADDPKLFNTENNSNARAVLKAEGYSEEDIEEMIGIINDVSFSKNRGRRPETAEGRIVQDADRLDAIGAVGIARTFAYGGEYGRPLKDSVQHFYDKLLLLKDLMNTETGKWMAEERLVFLEKYLKVLETELGSELGE